MHLSTSRRSLGGLALACLILGACAIASSPLSALEGDQKPAPKKGPAKATVTGAKSATAPAALIAAVPDLLQRRRQGIAAMLEGNNNYRGILAGGAAKIVDAKLAGPFEHAYTGLFSAEKTTLTLYCATVRLMVPMTADPIALISVEHPAEGGERMTARISNFLPRECRNADFKPFPELEQLRVQRRRALGHTD